MEYNGTYKSYMDYTNLCRTIIRNTLFTSDDTFNLNIVNDELGIGEIIKKHRLKMIDIKVDHTMRMVEQVVKINENLGLRINLGLVIKVATLYHDIGRMRQATWSNTFADSIYSTNTITSHKNPILEGISLFSSFIV